MLTQSPAAAQWAARWPEMASIATTYPGLPYRSALRNNRYCGCGELLSVPFAKAREWMVEVESNVQTSGCLRVQVRSRDSAL